MPKAKAMHVAGSSSIVRAFATDNEPERRCVCGSSCLVVRACSKFPVNYVGSNNNEHGKQLQEKNTQQSRRKIWFLTSNILVAAK